MELLVTLSRRHADGTVEAVALTADPAVVEATVTALERALRGPERARVLRLARDMGPDEPAPGATP